jgi:hypothetical protein
LRIIFHNVIYSLASKLITVEVVTAKREKIITKEEDYHIQVSVRQ